MNEYRAAMEYCVPSSDFAARLEERLLMVESNQRQHVIQPLSFAKKVLLAAVLTAVLTATVSAAVLVEWDEIFTDRFGQTPEEVPASETLFQQVYAESVCDDVTLRITEALGDSKTIYLILEYWLPDGTNLEKVRQAWEGEYPEFQVHLPKVEYYSTGDVSWSEYEAEMGHWWPVIDWRPQYEDAEEKSERDGYFYGTLPDLLESHRFLGGSASGVASQSFDAGTGVMTFLLHYNTESVGQNLTDQPLTVLVYPPVITVGEETTALADHPALISFQPAQTAKAKTGELRSKDEGFRVRVALSPFSINVDYYGSDYSDLRELAMDMTLVYRNGTEQNVKALSMGSGGG